MDRRTVFVRVKWDPIARVFVATSADVPGLVAEAARRDVLRRKLARLIPELLDLNGS